MVCLRGHRLLAQSAGTLLEAASNGRSRWMFTTSRRCMAGRTESGLEADSFAQQRVSCLGRRSGSQLNDLQAVVDKVGGEIPRVGSLHHRDHGVAHPCVGAAGRHRAPTPAQLSQR